MKKLYDRLNYNSNIFNNIFIHWFLVFGLVVFSPLIFIVNANAYQGKGNTIDDDIDLSNYYYYEFPYSYSGDKQYCYSNPIKLVPFSLSNNDGNVIFIYVDGKYSYKSSTASRISFSKNGNYSISSYDMDYAPAFNVSIYNEDDKDDYSFTSRYTTIYGFYVPKLFKDSDSSSFGTPIEIDKNDVNTYPVGHLEIVNPSGALSINYSNKYNAYPVDVKIKGKIPFQIKFGQESEISADKVKSILQKEIYNTMDFTMIGSNNTYTRSDKTFLNDNDPKLVVFGTKSDWIDNEYLTFEYTFKLYLKDKGDYNFNSFTINVPTWWEHTFFGIGTDKFKDFKADDVKFSINAYKDLNGDGVDDETGEVIPPQTDLDVDDDDWDHMTFLEKAEYLITSIPSFLGNIFDSLINTIANTVQLVNSVVAQGGTIAGLVTNLFNFFPAPIPQMITVTIGVMIFITFLSWVKK